jgi:hypothetical protein
MTGACLHLGIHEHPVKVGEDQEIKERTHKLVEEQVERTPKATNSAIVMEASKELVGELLINLDEAPVRKYDLGGTSPCSREMQIYELPKHQERRHRVQVYSKIWGHGRHRHAQRL